MALRDGIPARARDVARDGEERTVPARDLAARGVEFFPNVEAADSVRMTNARRFMREGQRDPIKVLVSPKGKLWIDNGRHRYLAALDMGLPIRVRFVRGV